MNNFHTKDFLFIDTVTLMVKDINKSLAFYKNVLGLKVLKTEDNHYYLGTNKRTLVILEHNASAIAKERITGVYHFALLLPDDRYLGQFINHLIKLNQRVVGGSDHGVSEAMYLNDPDGNGIEIYADREAYEWDYDNNGDVVMFTEMMDYEKLITNAYLELWTEMPEDTLMGHVHFHVNDIEKGKKFFIDTLGFQKTLNYGGSAIFLSDQKYHHHVGMNIWAGLEAFNRPYDMVGLVAYHLNVPKTQEDAFLKRIKANGYDIKNDEFGKYIIDINDVKVYF